MESASLVSDSISSVTNAPLVARRPTFSATKPLQSFALSLEDVEDCIVASKAAVPVNAVGSGTLGNSVAQPPTIIGSLVAAVFGQEAPPLPVAAAALPSSNGSSDVVKMPAELREGFASTPTVIAAVPNRMMVELAAMFDEPWATAVMGESSSTTLGVGEGSMLGHATPSRARRRVERMWSHHDRTLNVSFTLDRQPLRDGLFAYQSRLRMYGSSADNACTFILHDDAIRSGNPSMLSYDRLEDPGGVINEDANMVTGGFPESGVLHSCIKMPGFLKTRQYIACRRVWRWKDRPQCLVVSVPFAHAHCEQLCKGKGTRAQDFRMGYVVRSAPAAAAACHLRGMCGSRQGKPSCGGFDILVLYRPFDDEQGSGVEIGTVCFENFGVVPFVANGLAQSILWSTSKSFVSNFRSFEEAVTMAGSSGDIMATFQEVQAVHDSSANRKTRRGIKLAFCILGSLSSGVLGKRIWRTRPCHAR